MPIQKIVVLHGLYMSGLVMRPLCRRLEKQGYEILNLSYNTLSPDIEAISAQIDTFIADQKAALICHSMGGLIARHYLERGSRQSRQVEIVITLGTPHKGSSLARELSQTKLKKMLKNSLDYLLNENGHWPFEARLYSVAGDLPIGLMPLLHKGSNSDGTVLIDETCLTGMTEHKTFPLSHTSLIYSRRVLAYILEVLSRPGSDEKSDKVDRPQHLQPTGR